MDEQWCAECGESMRPLKPSGFARCCNGYAYWSDLAPLPADAVAYYQLHGSKPLQVDGLFLYRGAKCPAGF